MAENSAIAWTDHTFNPWIGCTKVSPACDRCYAESWANRFGKPELWKGKRSRTSPANWRKPLAWNASAAAYGERRQRVFCASLADVFDNQVPDEWRADLWRLIAATPNLDWLLLTKRPQNIAKMLPPGWGEGWPNVWLGTTVENQEEVERRTPHLTAIPAAVRFLSCEPLLAEVNLEPYFGGIDWVIAGGESGGGARPMHLEWARTLRENCAAYGVSFFVKQIGGVRDKRDKMERFPPDLRVREWPRPAAAPSPDCKTASGDV